MFKITPTARLAAVGAIALGFACAGFVASASAEDVAKGNGDKKPVSDVNAGDGGNNSSLRSNGVKDVNAGDGGNNSSLRSNGVKDVNAGDGGNNSSLRSNGVKDVNAGDGGNNSSLRSNGVKDVNAGDGGNNSSLRSNNVRDVNAGDGGNAANLRAQGLGIGSGGNPTGEGALLTGNCFADMPVYNKEGKFIGRGIVNTCN